MFVEVLDGHSPGPDSISFFAAGGLDLEAVEERRYGAVTAGVTNAGGTEDAGTLRKAGRAWRLGRGSVGQARLARPE